MQAILAKTERFTLECWCRGLRKVAGPLVGGHQRRRPFTRAHRSLHKCVETGSCCYRDQGATSRIHIQCAGVHLTLASFSQPER